MVSFQTLVHTRAHTLFMCVPLKLAQSIRRLLASAHNWLQCLNIAFMPSHVLLICKTLQPETIYLVFVGPVLLIIKSKAQQRS